MRANVTRRPAPIVIVEGEPSLAALVAALRLILSGDKPAAERVAVGKEARRT